MPALDMGVDVVQRGIRIPQLFFRMPAYGCEIQLKIFVDPGGDQMEDGARIVDDRPGQQGIKNV